MSHECAQVSFPRQRRTNQFVDLFINFLIPSIPDVPVAERGKGSGVP